MINRPWREQHRSWIMFLDDIKSHPDLISGKVEGNIYLLDCESARLSIWSEKWETFIDVGVSRLIRQERISMEGHVAPRDKGAHIFYKGIELQKTYIERDSELIEFIDIKKELPRRLINLSRGGFTREGEKYLKTKLYPGLLETIQSVLHDLEKQSKASGEEEKSFNAADCISRNIIKKADLIAEMLDEHDEDSRKLTEYENDLTVLVVSSAVLSYFATRKKWSIYSKMQGYNASRGDFWFLFLERIDEILHMEKYEKVLKRLSEMTSFFNLKVYDESGGPYYIRGTRNDEQGLCYFHNIFQRNNYWAILQIRKNQLSSWASYLIFFPENHRLKGDGENGALPVRDIYRQIDEIPHREDDSVLEEWSQHILAVPTQSGQNDDRIGADKNYTGGQQFILNWILKNVPTIALLCDESGNIRINVLSSKINPSIYMNKNFKFLIVQRLLEKARKENNNRFATIAWQGTEYLTCKDLSKHVLLVKRGYFSEYSCHELAVPYDKKTLENWGDQIEKGILKQEKFPQIKRLLKDMNIMGYVEELLQHDSGNKEDAEVAEFLLKEEVDIRQELEWDMIELIGLELTQEGYQPHATFQELLQPKEDRTLQWREIYKAVLRNYVDARKEENQSDDSDTGKELKPITENPYFFALCDAWYYLLIYGESVLDKNGLSQIQYNQPIVQPDPKEENMIRYIKENGYFHVDEADIRKNLNRYKQEILRIVQELESRDIQKEIHDFLNNYKFMLNSINLRRNQTSDSEEYDR